MNLTTFAADDVISQIHSSPADKMNKQKKNNSQYNEKKETHSRIKQKKKF